MKYFLPLFFLFCYTISFALTSTEKLNIIGSADVIVAGKVLAETIAFPLRTDTPVKNVSVKISEQYKGGVKSLFDITLSDTEPALKVGMKYLFFLKYSIGSSSIIIPSQKTNWYFMEGAEYSSIIDVVKQYPISVEITNPEVTLLYDKKNYIKCKITKAADAKVEILNVKLNLILSNEVKNNNVNPQPLIAIDKMNALKLTDKITSLNIPVKLRNSDDKNEYQVVIQPIFYLKINGIPCEYSGAITFYYISNKEI